ncbi:hypothetical protein EJB05_02370, partial [Eragrostis curvula]
VTHYLQHHISTNMYTKWAILLLVCAIICNHHVDGECTIDQKKTVLRHCKPCLYTQHPKVSAVDMEVCCFWVRMVPNRDMNCILNLCTRKEKEAIVVNNLLELEQTCIMDHVPPTAATPPHRPHQVMYAGQGLPGAIDDKKYEAVMEVSEN